MNPTFAVVAHPNRDFEFVLFALAMIPVFIGLYFLGCGAKSWKAAATWAVSALGIGALMIITGVRLQGSSGQIGTGWLVFIGFAGAALGLACFGTVASQRKEAACVQEIANSLGLKLVPGNWMESARLAGTWHGKPVEVFTDETGWGSARVQWVTVSARSAQDNGLAFALRGRGRWPKLSAWFGRRGPATGDAAFDAAWFARSNRPVQFAASLRPALRARLMETRAAMVADGTSASPGRYARKDGVTTCTVPGHLSRSNMRLHLPALLDFVSDLAGAVESA